MDTKLTIKLNKAVIERAKKHAAEKQLSLSRLIESYLDSVTAGIEQRFEISPFVKSISNGITIPADLDYKKEYTDHLNKKYK